MDGLTDGLVGRWMYGLMMDGWMDGQADVWGGWMGGQMDGWIDRDIQMGGRLGG